jgi:hypothetical protein
MVTQARATREFDAYDEAEAVYLRAIAGAVGSSGTQVARDLRSVVPPGTTEPPERVTGLDGKSYPATESPTALMQEGSPKGESIANVAKRRLMRRRGRGRGRTCTFLH